MECHVEDKYCFCVGNNVSLNKVGAQGSNCTYSQSKIQECPRCDVSKTVALHSCEECKKNGYKDGNQKTVCVKVHCDFSEEDRHNPKDTECLQAIESSQISSQVDENPKNVKSGVGVCVMHPFVNGVGLSNVMSYSNCNSDVNKISGNKPGYTQCSERKDPVGEQMECLINAKDDFEICPDSPRSATGQITVSGRSENASTQASPDHAYINNHNEYEEEGSRAYYILGNPHTIFRNESSPKIIINKNSALITREEAVDTNLTSRLLDKSSLDRSVMQHIQKCRDHEEAEENAEVCRFQRDSSQTEVKQVLLSDDERCVDSDHVVRGLQNIAKTQNEPKKINYGNKSLQCRPTKFSI